MVVNQALNDVIDVMVYSDVEVKQELQILRFGGELKGDAVARAFESLKKDLSKTLTDEKFVEKIERGMGFIRADNMPADKREKIAHRLNQVANGRIQKENKNLNPFTRFFHKLGQLFAGHGFRTEGEYWSKVHAKLVAPLPPSDKFKRLATAICHGPGLPIAGDPADVVREMLHDVNELPSAKFKELLDRVIFRQKEPLQVDQKKKYVFFHGLSDGKKQEFITRLLARTDWFMQALDVIEEITVVDHPDFVTDVMVESFQQSFSDILPKISPNASEQERGFLHLLCAKAVKMHLDRDELTEIGKLLEATKPRHFKVEDMLKVPGVFSEADLQRLQENFDNPMFQ